MHQEHVKHLQWKENIKLCHTFSKVRFTRYLFERRTYVKLTLPDFICELAVSEVNYGTNGIFAMVFECLRERQVQ